MGRTAGICAAAVVLLAPVSTYGVRFYTEIIAACLLVWALVCWDVSRERPRFLVPVALVALGLPVLHGRYLVLSAGLGVLVLVHVVGMLRVHDRRTVVMVAGGLAAMAGLALAAFQLSVGLQERLEPSYIATNWTGVSLVGVLFDRGSGLLPVAPWAVLALWTPRPLQPIQRVALGLILLQLAAVVIRAGGWQTWGAPARYILPVVPLLALLVAPVVEYLLSQKSSRILVLLPTLWSVAMTLMLHWLPLSGYVPEGRYLIDEAWRGVAGFSPLVVFPLVAPGPGSFALGTLITFGLLVGAGSLLVAPYGLSFKREETPQRGVSSEDTTAVA